MSTRIPWIAGQRKNSEQVKHRLFCFSHAGGGSSLYTSWRNAFGSEVEVCPVLLPGREARMNEKPFRRMDDIIPVIVESLTPFMDKPFSLFGHSLGSVLAFETARKVTGMGLPLDMLIVSGRRAAHLRAKREPVYQLDDDGFLQAIDRLNGTPKEVLEDKQIMGNFLPYLRADFELHETYQPLRGSQLTCDLLALMGDSDPEVNESELIAWRELTSGQFNYRIFNGDHFYLQPPCDELLSLVGEHLVTTSELVTS